MTNTLSDSLVKLVEPVFKQALEEVKDLLIEKYSTEFRETLRRRVAERGIELSSCFTIANDGKGISVTIKDI